MSNDTISLPDTLRRQFEELERRLWRIDAAVAVCGGAGALIVSCGMLFISDRFWDTPSWLRAVFSLLGVGLLLWFLYGYGRKWVWGKRGFESLAGLVQKRYRRLGDRLLGIVELADASRRPENVSAALCSAAIGQVAEEAARIDFREAASPKRSYRYGRWLAILLALAAAPCFLAPNATWNAVQRWIWPGARVERYTFVRLGDLPGRRVVARGEPFEIACSVDDNWLWEPSWATCRFEDQAAIDSPIVRGRILFHVPGQTQSGFLTLRAGDVTKKIFIEPVFRPELTGIAARIDLPEYLGYPPVTEKIEGGSFTVLRGSHVAFQGTASRDLQDAEMTLDDVKTPVEVRADTFYSAPVALEGFSTCRMEWTDVLGLAAPVPAVFKLQIKEDAPPDVECPGLAEALAILEEEVVKIPVSAQDDYGLREIGLTWEVTHKGDKSPAPEETRTLQKGGPQVLKLKGSFDFSPALLHIPEDSSVSMRAVAADYFPGRKASESVVYHIYVLSREAHARLIKEQFDKLAAQLEELTRKQEALLDAGNEVHDQKPEKLADAESAQKLGDQAAEQSDNAEELKGIAKEMAGTVREGLRNSDISEKLLQDSAQQAAAMAGLAQKEMPDAARRLTASSQQQAARAAELAKALAQEQKILESLQALQKSGSDSADKLANAIIALRLRKIAGSEKRVAATFQKILPDTVGMRPEQMSPEQRQQINEMRTSEETSRTESSEVQDEIARFFDRTRVTSYGDVSQDMVAAKIDEGLDHLAQLVAKNTSVASIQGAGEWAGRFDQWAEKLENSNGAKSPSSGESQPMSEQQLRAMLALVRIRQQEGSLRDQTVALDKVDQPHPDSTSPRALATTQQELQEAVHKLQGDANFPLPPSQLEPVRRAMEDAGTLLAQSVTGDATVASQMDAINIIDFLLNGSGGGAGAGGASLAMLREMMGMSASGGNSGTGSMAGGVADRPNAQVAGSRIGEGEGPRAVTTTGGKEIESVPVEFRDALESYYGAIEQAN